MPHNPIRYLKKKFTSSKNKPHTDAKAKKKPTAEPLALDGQPPQADAKNDTPPVDAPPAVTEPPAKESTENKPEEAKAERTEPAKDEPNASKPDDDSQPGVVGHLLENIGNGIDHLVQGMKGSIHAEGPDTKEEDTQEAKLQARGSKRHSTADVEEEAAAEPVAEKAKTPRLSLNLFKSPNASKRSERAESPRATAPPQKEQSIHSTHDSESEAE